MKDFNTKFCIFEKHFGPEKHYLTA